MVSRPAGPPPGRAGALTSSVFAIVICATIDVGNLRADEPAPTPASLKAAITKAIPQLEKGTAGSGEQRTCFTCHNQAVPVFALVEARKRGFAVDKENLDRQIQHTAAHLEGGRQDYLEGRGQGGKVLTAGYALWMLEAADYKPDETTSAVVEFLLNFQKDDTHWTHPGKRPPSSGSEFSATYVALRGLSAFGTPEQKQRADARTATVNQWLASEKPADTEDRVFHLQALQLIGGHEQDFQEAVNQIIEQQRTDGGWAQLEKMESDAYATSTVLVALLSDHPQQRDTPAIRRGIKYLLDTQLPDGSWRVTTRAEPFQTYYESGFPNGPDQFISITASSWATLALLLALPETR